jgi:hypothetical protein
MNGKVPAFQVSHHGFEPTKIAQDWLDRLTNIKRIMNQLKSINTLEIVNANYSLNIIITKVNTYKSIWSLIIPKLFWLGTIHGFGHWL